MTTLVAKIAEQRSYRKIAAEAIDPITGEQLSFHYLNDLGRGRVASSPSPARLRALAAGLHVPEDDLKQLAALQWLGYDITTVQVREGEVELWATVRQLNADDLATMRAVADGLLARHTRTHPINRDTNRGGDTPDPEREA